MLELKRLNKRFGGVVAVKNVSLNINRKEIVGLIGPNGSGKTTLFNLITGFLKPDSGDILFKGESIVGFKPHQIAQRGIGRTFQLVKNFKKMTVLENLLVVPSRERKTSSEAERERILEFLKFVELAHLKDEFAGNLSYGQGKLLELVKALMLNPELILLDEPVAGINPVLIKKIVNFILFLNEKEKKTFIIVEHNIPVIMDICDRVIVLAHGKVIAEGSPEEIRKDRAVIDAYLGGGSSA